MIRCGVLGRPEWADRLQGDGSFTVVALGEELRAFRPERHRGGLDVLIVTAAALRAAAASPAQVHDSLQRLLPDCTHLCVRERDDPPCDGWPSGDVYVWPDDAFRLSSRLHGANAWETAPAWWDEAAPALATVAAPAEAVPAVPALDRPLPGPGVERVPAPLPPLAAGTAPWPAASAPQPVVAAGHVATGQLVSVIGAKGGVGQTWLAINLAAALASQVGMECLLADLDLASADVALYLDMLGAPTIVDIVQQADEDGWPWSGLHQLRSCPLRVLTGPERPQMASLLTAADVAATIGTLQERFAFTVCDHGPGDTDPLFLDLSEHAAAVVLVTTLDAPALRQAKLRLEHLEQRGLLGRTHLVLNQLGPGGLAPADAAAYLAHGAYTVVPPDRKRVEQSLHEARPLALQSRSEAGRAVHTLAAALTGQGPVAAAPEPAWRRWLEQLWQR